MRSKKKKRIYENTKALDFKDCDLGSDDCFDVVIEIPKGCKYKISDNNTISDIKLTTNIPPDTSDGIAEEKEILVSNQELKDSKSITIPVSIEEEFDDDYQEDDSEDEYIDTKSDNIIESSVSLINRYRTLYNYKESVYNEIKEELTNILSDASNIGDKGIELNIRAIPESDIDLILSMYSELELLIKRQNSFTDRVNSISTDDNEVKGILVDFNEIITNLSGSKKEEKEKEIFNVIRKYII